MKEGGKVTVALEGGGGQWGGEDGGEGDVTVECDEGGAQYRSRGDVADAVQQHVWDGLDDG